MLKSDKLPLRGRTDAQDGFFPAATAQNCGRMAKTPILIRAEEEASKFAGDGLPQPSFAPEKISGSSLNALGCNRPASSEFGRGFRSLERSSESLTAIQSVGATRSHRSAQSADPLQTVPCKTEPRPVPA